MSTPENPTILDLKKVKTAFQEHEARFYELRGHIISCARKIKIFMLIVDYKQKSTAMYGEPFWGWLQMETICPEIMLSCCRLAEGLSKYILDFLKLILPQDLAIALIKNSQLKQGTKALNKTAKEFELFRNKRAAHIECIAISPITFDIKILYDNLGTIDSSLDYIAHFLVNPHLIAEERWDVYKIGESQDLDNLEEYFNGDHAIQACTSILNYLHHETQKPTFTEIE
ncbi:hypothetical protein [Legionella resiliens]|uniref:HEPN AbiU2-like domain-containing protein n=1 Tax=Legionella resiliens TaxID=2905958 RepID=A0ABS8X7H0_9GAMM|nr:MULTISPECIES: hypothetical protein [unclassified Legionella]MCE0723982.1 hypothetical protein [Legionella sp. 9fVS26]MCE3533135.1 hypothetical protein [Legionella sp. 8cVS16]